MRFQSSFMNEKNVTSSTLQCLAAIIAQKMASDAVSCVHCIDHIQWGRRLTASHPPPSLSQVSSPSKRNVSGIPSARPNQFTIDASSSVIAGLAAWNYHIHASGAWCVIYPSDANGTQRRDECFSKNIRIGSTTREECVESRMLPLNALKYLDQLTQENEIHLGKISNSNLLLS